MPTIHTRCPSCRQHMDLPASDCALLDGPGGHPVAYAFVCCHCREPIMRRADGRTMAMLVASGASAHGGQEQAVALCHPEQPAPGPPLTADDLIDLHVLLDAPGWFEQLAG